MIEWMNDRSVIRKERKKEGKKKGKKKLMKEQLINQWINESLMDRKDWKKPATTRGGVGKVGRGGGEGEIYVRMDEWVGLTNFSL